MAKTTQEVHVRVPMALYRAIVEAAREDERSVNATVVRALRTVFQKGK